MRTTQWDRVVSSAPLDATAATVRDGSGDLWEAKRPDTWQHWKAPPPPTAALKAGSPELTGRMMGRMTVLRFHGYSGISDPRPVWLVRCQCGDYEVRRAKSIIKNADPDAGCFECERVKQLRARSAKPSTRKTREAAAQALESYTKSTPTKQDQGDAA